MNLRGALASLQRNVVLLAAVLAACVLAALLYTLIEPPTYDSTAKLYVTTSAGSTTTDLVQGVSFTQQVVGSYADIATTPYVLQPIIDDLRLDTTTDRLAQRVAVTVPVNQTVLQIQVGDPDAHRAADIANAIAARLKSAVVQLNPDTTARASVVKITQVQSAAAAERPTTPNPVIDLALGVLLGLLLGGAVVAARESLDTRVRTAADLEAATDAPLLGRTLAAADAARSPLVVRTDTQGAEIEAYRTLRANLRYLEPGRSEGAIVITSSVAGEGKSVLACNLAEAIAETTARVLLVDADLRRPAIAGYLGLSGDVGLTDVVVGAATLEDAVQVSGTAGLRVLPAGGVPPNPNELLQSEAMGSLLARLQQAFDVVVIDAPPLLPVTDAAILARATRGAIVVAGAGRVTRPQLAEALAVLRRLDGRALGVVAARLPRSRKAAGYDYSSYRSAT